MTALLEQSSTTNSLGTQTRHSVVSYLRQTRHNQRHIPLSEIARYLGIAPDFLEGAIWGATELSNSDVAHLVEAQSNAAATPAAAQNSWSDDEDAAWSPDRAWPTFVAKEGSD
jgi:hypothetical protein